MTTRVHIDERFDLGRPAGTVGVNVLGVRR
jgi:hypothetical protein